MVVISAGFNQAFKGVAINMMILVALIIAPFFFWSIILMNYKILGTPEAIKKFGTLY
jgi:hypothetical protein